MDFSKFTEKLQEGVREAQSKAVRYSHQQVDVEHLLAALLEQEGGLAPSVLLKAGVDVEGIHRRLEEELARQPKVYVPHRQRRPGLHHRAAAAGSDQGRRRSQEAPGRVHLGRARAARHRRRQRRRWPHSQGIRRHPRAPDAGSPGGPRNAARHLGRIPRPPTRRWKDTGAT